MKAKLRICKCCLEEFDYTKTRGKTFCSLECRDVYKKNNTIYNWLVNNYFSYGKRITKWQKEFVKKQNKYTCSNCNKQFKNVQIHHINGNNLDNRYANLTLLCPNCHSLTHNYSRRKTK